MNRSETVFNSVKNRERLATRNVTIVLVLILLARLEGNIFTGSNDKGISNVNVTR